MLLSLTVITLVAAGLLAGVNELTKATIEEANAKKQQAAIVAVLPQVAGLTLAEVEKVGDLEIYKAFLGEELIGAAVKVEENGFGGAFHLMVGFDAEGAISGYEVLDHQETPGLGSKMQEWFHKNAPVVGLNPAEKNMTVSKDGGDVDAITAATISSRAFLAAVQKAYAAYTSANAEAAPVKDACCEATACCADSAAICCEAAADVAEEVAAENVELANEEE